MSGKKLATKIHSTMIKTKNLVLNKNNVTKPLNDVVIEANAIVCDAFKRYKNIGLAFSGGTDSNVMLNLVYPYKKDMPIIFVHTQDEFPESVQFVHETQKRLGLNLYEVKAPENRHKQYRQELKNHVITKQQFIQTCCEYHKINPLLKAISDLKLDACFVGIRGSEHEERRKAGIFEPKVGHYRVHPLMNWTISNVLQYVKEFNIPSNPLYSQGYKSLGCQLCTSKCDALVERGGRDADRDGIMKTLREAGYT